MYASSEQRLTRFINAGYSSLLPGGLKGLEKESLRVSPDGWIARTPHPGALGSALTHPYITTDYSEALLEFVTPPFVNVHDTMEFLDRIHRFVYSKLDDEMLWATSMPCRVGDDASIPIGRYGTSNVGTMKHVYRRGLSHRYGSVMQTIAGIHFNYSFPEPFWAAWRDIESDRRPRHELISDGYFRLVRNFQRFGWLVPYLFGASPAICKSFLAGREGEFEEFDSGTWYQSFATSLRLSDIGYKNKNQAALRISLNHLDDYVESLTRAIATPFPAYEAIGVRENGEYRQLSPNFLQIENEYYSFIRPKQIAQSGEKPTLALKRRGVRYVEVRALDVGAFDPTGVNEEQLRFIEAFLGFCMFQDSPPVSDEEQRLIEHNQSKVACCGRDPHLSITINGESRPVAEWATLFCQAMRGYCELLDSGNPDVPYVRGLERQLEVAANPALMPSSRVLAEMRARDESFFEFALRKSLEHKQFFEQPPLAPDVVSEFEALAAKSLEEQAQIEARDELSFGQYLERYFAQA